jgi:hypothetical protein
LECGLRLPLARGAVGTLATHWRRRLPWYPGDWVWPVLALLLIAAVGGAIVYLVTRGEPAERTIVATTPVATPAPPTTTAGTLPATTPASTTAQPSPSSLVSWPAGTSGYTTVLQSLPVRSGRVAAVALARRAARAGLPQVGYLRSSRFSSLHAGYYVVFSGIFRSAADADDNAATASSKGFAAAYSQQIVP